MNSTIRYISLASMLLLGACSGNGINETEETFPAMVSIGVSTDDTRTSLGDKTGNTYSVLWSQGDCIAVNGNISDPVDEQYVNSTRAYFTVASSEAPYNVAYPAGAIYDGGIVISGEQTYSSGQFDSAAGIMVGYGQTTTIQLQHVCSYIKIVLNQAESEQLSSMVITARGAESISGKFAVDFQTAAATAAGDNSSSITVAVDGSIPYSEGKASIIVAVPAGTYSKGFLVTFATKGGDVMNKYAYSSGKTLEAGRLYPMAELTYDSMFSGGVGTAESPYLISSAEDLALLASLTADANKFADYNDKYYSQTADIDFSISPSTRTNTANMTPIGPAEERPFTGVYNGNGHSISGIVISNESTCTGLFGYMNSPAIVSNLTIMNSTFTGQGSSVGAICGAKKNGTIDKCSVKSCAIVGASYYVGGICGYNNYGNITNCDVDSQTNVTGARCVGGILGCGYVGNSKTYQISKCTCSATLSSTEADKNGYAPIGGIIGYVYVKQAGNDKILECSFSGTVASSAGSGVGGIAGYIVTLAAVKHVTTIQKCTSTSTLSLLDVSHVGGIVGFYVGYSTATSASLVIDQCTSKGDISARIYAGGIIGCANPVYGKLSITSCRASGDIAAITSHAGGIGGSLLSYGTISIDKCATYGNVTTVFCASGFCGFCGVYATSAKFSVTNSGYFGSTIDCLGNNGSAGYTLGGGFFGWAQASSGNMYATNCVSRVQTIKYVSTYGGNVSKKSSSGGIMGANTSKSAGKLYIDGCYTTIERSGIICDGQPITAATTTGYGGIYGLGTSVLTTSKSYYSSQIDLIGTNGTINACEQCADAATFKARMNAFVSEYTGTETLVSWVDGTDGYPVPSGIKDTDTDL